MNISDNLLKTAMLGTAKSEYAIAPALTELQEQIKAKAENKEDAFLRYAFVALRYQEVGQLALEAEANLPICPAEQGQFAPVLFAQKLAEALQSADEILLGYLLKMGRERAWIAPPELAPKLLNWAKSHQRKAADWLALAGACGAWLISMNEDWKSLAGKQVSEDDTWETGSFEFRKQFLQSLRETDPKAAIPLLEQAFPQENANNRLAFLEILATGLSLADMPFLTSLSSDKSKKISGLAAQLLKGLPGSPSYQLILSFLQKALSVKEQRFMLVSKKKVLDFNAQIQPSKELFEAGIEQVSTQKGFSDHRFWIAQAIACLHPKDWLPSLGLSASEFCDLLMKESDFELLRPYLETTTIHFQYSPFAEIYFNSKMGENIRVIQAIAPENRTQFYRRMFEMSAFGLMNVLLEGEAEIPLDIATRILQACEEQPYQHTKPDYRKLALQLPLNIKPQLRAYAAQVDHPDSSQKRYFAGQAFDMLQVLEFRESLKF